MPFLPKNFGRSALAIAAIAGSLGLASSALAVEQPLDLAPPDKTAAAAKEAKVETPKLTDDEVVAKANASLEEARVMSADFVQIGPDGTRAEGVLAVSRPGKMLFRFNPPHKLEIIANGRSVAIRDQKLGTQDLYLIGQTPLKFLLNDHIDLTKDTTVKRVALTAKAATVEIEDKATFGGKSEIALVFDPQTFALKQWTVLDPQGFQTVVTLFDIDLVSKPDPAQFYIDESVATGGSNKTR